MIRKLIVALTALTTLSAAAAASEPAHPKLRAEAVIAGDIVRIGDLVENAGIVAQVPIFRAPDLGFSGTVSADAVAEAVRPHALIGLDTGGLREVVVTRASRQVEAQAVENCLTAALSAQFALGPAKDLRLIYDRELRTQYVEPSAKGGPRVLQASYDSLTGRFDATLDIPGRAPLRLTGRAQPTVAVVTIAHALARGEIIKHADVVTERRPRAEAGRDLVVDREQAIGLAARNALQPGQVLRTADTMKPELVQRNETVTLIYEVPGVTLTVRGKALEAGAEGDTIGVLNEQSKRTIQGVVIAPGRLIIPNGAPKLAANLPPAAAAPAGGLTP